MKPLYIIMILIVSGCSTTPNPITEDEVEATIEGFFEAIDVENEDPNLIDDYVTDDFFIYEGGKKMSKQEFIDFVAGATILKSDWKLSDFRISVDVNSAHASLLNNGEFVFQSDSVESIMNYEWLESAYLVRVEDKLKIKFYFSDNIKVESNF